MDIKKTIGQIVFITMMTSSISFASTYHIELNASYSAIEARFDNTLALEQGVLTTGIGAIYSDDDYKIANVKLTLGDGMLLPGLKFNLGFKGILGDIEKGNKQGDLMAIGFLFSGKYSIPEAVSPIPIDVSVGINVAPEPLCFLDSDRYWGFRTSLDFRIVKNAAIILGYRNIEVRFDEDPGRWEMSDDTIFLGCQLSF
jgi:hypothetical protein